MIILKNEIIEIKIILNIFYIKLLNFNNFNEDDIKKIIFYYQFFHLICLENKIKFTMILDFLNFNISIISIYNNINFFTKLLNDTRPITNITVNYSILILSELSKKFVNIILQIYKPSKPIYFVSNKSDIMNLY